MMPWVSMTEAVAAPGDAEQVAPTQAMVSPMTSTSPAKATSGVTTMPLRRSLSTSPFLTRAGGVAPGEQGPAPPDPVVAAALDDVDAALDVVDDAVVLVDDAVVVVDDAVVAPPCPP